MVSDTGDPLPSLSSALLALFNDNALPILQGGGGIDDQVFPADQTLLDLDVATGRRLSGGNSSLHGPSCFQHEHAPLAHRRTRNAQRRARLGRAAGGLGGGGSPRQQE